MTKKKKIAILTINVNLMNYGNRLQNYALQEVLRKLGCEVLTVNYSPVYPVRPSSNVNNYNNKRPITLQRIKNKLVREIFNLRNKIAMRHKILGFNNFVSTKISWTNTHYTIDSDFSGLDSEFDYIIAGSDQIWNPYWEGTQPVYFMGFVPENKRIAYAASFGVSKIPDDVREQYKKYLAQIPCISCREDSGCDIIQELTGKRPKLVLDPVFLLDKSEWEILEKKPHISAKNYILVYFLGKIPDEAYQRIKFFKSQGLSVIYLDKIDKFNSCFASPEEFLYLVNHSKTVLTDSFHGCVFSIIYNKAFIYFARELSLGPEQDMSTRFSSLFNMLNINRYNENLHENELLTMDYNEINNSVAFCKKMSLEFLKEAIR